MRICELRSVFRGVALWHVSRAPRLKGAPRSKRVVIAATEDGSVDQSNQNFIALGDELLSQLELS